MQYKEQADLVDLLNRNRVDTGTHAWESYLSGPGEQAPDSAFIPRFVPLPNDTTVASFAMPSELKNINESRCAGPKTNPKRDAFFAGPEREPPADFRPHRQETSVQPHRHLHGGALGGALLRSDAVGGREKLR